MLRACLLKLLKKWQVGIRTLKSLCQIISSQLLLTCTKRIKSLKKRPWTLMFLKQNLTFIRTFIKRNLMERSLKSLKKGIQSMLSLIGQSSTLKEEVSPQILVSCPLMARSMKSLMLKN